MDVRRTAGSEMMTVMGKLAQTVRDDSAHLHSLLEHERPLESKHPTLSRESPDGDRRNKIKLYYVLLFVVLLLIIKADQSPSAYGNRGKNG